MAVLQPDTSAAQDFTTPIAPGTYKAKIISCDAGKSKAGNDKIVPKFEIYVGDQKRSRQAHLVVSGEGSAGFDQLLRATKNTQLADAFRNKNLNPKPSFDTDTLVGQEVMVVVEENLYTPEGGSPQKRDQISSFLPV